jgi:hypothetical protein
MIRVSETVRIVAISLGVVLITAFAALGESVRPLLLPLPTSADLGTGEPLVTDHAVSYWALASSVYDSGLGAVEFWIAWTGLGRTAADRGILAARSANATDWMPAGFVPMDGPAASASTPALVVRSVPTLSSAGDVAIAWAGEDGNIYYVDSPRNLLATAFARRESIGGLILSGTGPSMTFARPNATAAPSGAYIAWAADDHSLRVASRDASGTWDVTPFAESSLRAPAIKAYADTLYVVWTGMDQEIYLASSSDGVHFGSKAALGEMTDQAPALAILPDGRWVLGWRGFDNRLHTKMGTVGIGFGRTWTTNASVVDFAGPALADHTFWGHDLTWIAWTDPSGKFRTMMVPMGW